MSLRIQNNVEAFNAHRNLSSTEGALGKSMERLSSGYRINRAADDAAGLAISERLRGQINGLDQAQRNAQDKNGSLSTADRTAIQSEVNQLGSEIERIGSSAEFNGIKLLNSAQTISFQVGAADAPTITVSTISLGNTQANGGVGTSFFALASNNTVDISEIDAAIDNVSALRAQFGAVQNRLEYTLENAAIYQENLTASESRIRDVDMAAEMVEFTKLQILQQAGTSMLAQANQASQGVLALLR